MKDIRVVIGANFGDEGKGLMADYFCGSMPGGVLNVRFNGTSQAGHTVERDGMRHVFSHFGSGSFIDGVATYLSSDFYFNPVSYFNELEELNKKGIKPIVYISSQSQAITIYDVFFNCIIEEYRGQERHGSCGAGLWEALLRYEAGYSITAGEYRNRRQELKNQLTAVRDEYYAGHFKELGVPFGPDSEWYEVWHDEGALDNYIELFMEMLGGMSVVDEKDILNNWDRQVYEGAQGLLLDYDNDDYMPNLTASYTGSKNVVKLVNQIDGPVDLEICYVTRTYFTRHGAGRFETETEKDNLGENIFEETNVTNRWQGSFRWGYFDMPLFIKTILNDEKWHRNLKIDNFKKTISFTHTDCTDNMLILPDGRQKIADMFENMSARYDGYYCCNGKTAKTVVFNK